MPLKMCTIGNKPGWKWGDEGTCYTYEKGDEVSENDARESAHKQGIAIGYRKVDRVSALHAFVLRQDVPPMSDEQCAYALGVASQLKMSEDLSDYEVVRRIGDVLPYLRDGEPDEDAMVASMKFINAGSINPRPEEKSFMDKKTVLIRYKYEGPISDNSREFCRYMIANFSNDYFRREDINQMSFSSANNEFGTYSIWNYKGSFNCKHAWVAYVFRLRKGEDISDASQVVESIADSSLVNARVKR